MRKDGRCVQAVCQVHGLVPMLVARGSALAGVTPWAVWPRWARTSKGPSAPARQVGTLRVRDADTGHKGEIVWDTQSREPKE